jgi:hypothetical protein
MLCLRSSECPLPILSPAEIASVRYGGIVEQLIRILVLDERFKSLVRPAPGHEIARARILMKNGQKPVPVEAASGGGVR